MEFTSSYFHTFGNPDFAAVFSGGGSAQALRPCPPSTVDAAGVKSEKIGAARHATPSVFCVPDAEVAEAHHFLDECALCRKFLSGDIFMYRGDTPFCSEECRRKQIEMDRTKHRRKKQHSPTAQAQAQAQVQVQAVAHIERAPQRQLQPN